ncbi:MAG: integrase [Firmicutes bacterium HGW-Firmicutes-13]|nr:MAG: integrase [Firmicutes bacterium HGW-Firmicutes-13]
MLLEYCIQDFLSYLEVERGSSPNTIEGYAVDLGLFLSFLKQNELPLSAEDITVQHLRQFLVYLKKERNNSPVTVKRKVSTLKSLYNFICRERVYGISNNPAIQLATIKTCRKLPQILSLEECRVFLAGIKQVSSFPERDYAMFILFLQSGCRLLELKSLRLSDLDLKEKTVRFLGKGNKERVVPLTGETCRALESYLNVRRPRVETDFLFISSAGKPVSKRGIQLIFRNLAVKTGIYRSGLSVHKLRHTCLTLLLKEGVDIRCLQEIAGHADISTTQVYTHVAGEDIRRQMEKHPLAAIESGTDSQLIKELPMKLYRVDIFK